MKKVTVTAYFNSKMGGFSNATIYAGTKKDAAIGAIKKEPKAVAISIDGAGSKNLFYGTPSDAINYLEGQDVKKNPVKKKTPSTRKPQFVYAVTVTQKRTGKKLYLQSFASGYDANIMQPVFTDEKEKALAFDHGTAKGAAWALGKVLHKHKFSVSAITAKK